MNCINSFLWIYTNEKLSIIIILMIKTLEYYLSKWNFFTDNIKMILKIEIAFFNRHREICDRPIVKWDFEKEIFSPLSFFPLSLSLWMMLMMHWFIFKTRDECCFLSQPNCVNTIHFFSATSSTRRSPVQSQLIDDENKEGERTRFSRFLTNEIWFRDMRTYSSPLFLHVYCSIQFPPEI